MSLFKRDDCLVVLIRLLVELAEQFPWLVVLSILLDGSLEAKHSFLHLTLLDEFLRHGQEVDRILRVFVHVFVLLLERDNFRVFCHLQLVVFFPNVAPGVHHFIHILHLASFLHPLLHHLLHVVIRKLLLALQDVSKQILIRFLRVYLLAFFCFLLRCLPC